MKILFGKITDLIDSEFRNMLERGCIGRLHIPFWSMTYLLLRLKFISETDHGAEFNFQFQMNHGPEWNVELSIPVQIPH